MQAIMLAAGVGECLSNHDHNHLPKCLLSFDGQSLLARHIKILKANGIEKLTLVVGYQAHEIDAELASIDAGDFVKTVTNSAYRDGSIVSLGCADTVLRSGDEILFMDADVLYHSDLIRKLTASTAENCIIFDTDFDPNSEPVLLCLKDDRIVEFSKNVNVEHDTLGEWPGFVKWSPEASQQIADFINREIGAGATHLPYEEAFRDFLLNPKRAQIDFQDIAGLPWIEIDFPAELERAHNVILPAIKNIPGTF